MNGWFIPVNSSEISVNAKFHYFQENISLCKYYSMDTDYYETDMRTCGYTFSKEIVCKRCLKKATENSKGRHYIIRCNVSF